MFYLFYAPIRHPNKRANIPTTIRARKTMSSAFSFLTPAHCLPQCSQPSPSLPPLSFPSSPQGFCQGKAPGLSAGTSTLTQNALQSPPHPPVFPSLPLPTCTAAQDPIQGLLGTRLLPFRQAVSSIPSPFLVLTLKHCSPVILVP